MDKIFIRDLRICGILGVYEHERHTPQDILVNITLFTDTHRAAKTDDLADCVDYDALAQSIRAMAESARRFTVEALAEDIADLCLNRPRVRKVTVRVEKPGAIREASSAGVEIERKRK